jgi:hypothetical protein
MAYPEIDAKASSLVLSIQKLTTQGSAFYDTVVTSLAEPFPPGTSMTADPTDGFHAELFGVPAHTIVRPIMSGGVSTAIEYLWVIEYGGIVYDLTRMYLVLDSTQLSSDPGGIRPLFAWGDVYVAKLLIGLLLDALPFSSVFAQSA